MTAQSLLPATSTKPPFLPLAPLAGGFPAFAIAPARLVGIVHQAGVCARAAGPESEPGNCPVCPDLAEFGFQQLSVFTASAAFDFQLPVQKGAQLLIGTNGAGWVQHQPIRQTCLPNTLLLLPPGRAIGLRRVSQDPWQFCCIAYDGPGFSDFEGEQPERLSMTHDPRTLWHAIQSLHLECAGARDPANCHLLLALIHRWTERITQSLNPADRLQQLWKKVRADLGGKWSVALMAREAHCCDEHLRRLCHCQFGCSPMQHLLQLRMRAAAEMLTHPDTKVEAIALAMGYQNSSSFSLAFKRWSGGIYPSEFRAHPGHITSGA